MFAVLIPVGPGARDEWRLGQLVHEIERHEGREGVRLVVIDDAPAPRELALDWPALEVVRTPLRTGGTPDLLSAHVAGTLAGMQAAGDVEFLIKLDTDAAVIGGFAAALRQAFSEPELGVVGSYDVMADGGTRDWSIWKPAIDRASWPLWPARTPEGLQLWRRDALTRKTIRAVREAAYRAAPAGAHCLGGAYAVSRTFLERAWLDWRPWVRTGLGEDVVVGMLCSHAGLAMKSLTRPGQPFAIAWKGLPAAPGELLARGHSLVHSVKCDEEHEEAALRAAFRQSMNSATR